VYFLIKEKIMKFHLKDEVIEEFTPETMSISDKPFGEAARILKYDSFARMMEDIKESIEFKHDYAIDIVGFYTDPVKTLPLDENTVVGWDTHIYLDVSGA
jgi:hypothetical protein